MAVEEILNENDSSKNNINSVMMQSLLTMVSSCPVDRTGRRSCLLTPLDRAMSQHMLHVIFYYQSGSFGYDRVKAALNEILTLYPNVTGRLSKDGEGNWEVKFTDAGVRVYLAKVKCSVDEWLRSSGLDDEAHLTVQDDLPDDPQFWPPFKLQITEFEGGGTAIALSCPHMLADPITATLLIKAWTDAHHHDIIAYPPLLPPTTLSNPPKTNTVTPPPAYSPVKSGISSVKHSSKMGSATFSFSESTIKQLVSEVASVVPDATPFDILTALLWTRVASVKSTITICMDMRKQLRAPLPNGYFGNAVYFSNLTLSEEDMNGHGQELGRVTELVHRFVAGVTEDELFSAINWLESSKASPCKMYGSELTFVNMEHMIAPFGIHGKEHEGQALMYMTSFDKDEKPAHVSYHVGNVEGKGLILVMPAPEGGLARRVSVTLPEDEIRKLVEDDVILGLKPTLMLSGRA